MVSVIREGDLSVYLPSRLYQNGSSRPFTTKLTHNMDDPLAIKVELLVFAMGTVRFDIAFEVLQDVVNSPLDAPVSVEGSDAVFTPATLDGFTRGSEKGFLVDVFALGSGRFKFWMTSEAAPGENGGANGSLSDFVSAVANRLESDISSIIQSDLEKVLTAVTSPEVPKPAAAERASSNHRSASGLCGRLIARARNLIRSTR